ncbi:hypothetical protein VISI1226_13658 [Vibrio sinaloensis DSM 21326]|uniref:Uncharacterized protein n=1 Tax=Vibrio sinaloensis DSM 21326 TaxID=945550 RepID=E8M8M7_PHOS4|nr:hypothetical protein [Vibrio sinaloensis]EGA69572.1 hypothetical protein VISI1226_13658 [Vibrio sinaloensis DSM 21326]
MESALINALASWGVSPQFLVLAALMMMNMRSQNKINRELTTAFREMRERVLVVETKQQRLE